MIILTFSRSFILTFSQKFLAEENICEKTYCEIKKIFRLGMETSVIFFKLEVSKKVSLTEKFGKNGNKNI